MEALDPSRCPRCGALRVEAADCPRCGVIYARAEERERARVRAQARAVATVAEEEAPQTVTAAASLEGTEAFRVLAPPTADRDPEAEASRVETRLRLWVVPAALVLAFLFAATGAGGFVSRVVSGMWLHELGHASAAWLFGYNAVPLPWFTSISATRSFVPTLLFAGGFGYLAWRRWSVRERRGAFVFGGVALAAVAGRLLPAETARMLITFWGDGGALVYATLLVCSFYVARGSWMHRGALRWGFVGLGALGFADVFLTWWHAWGDAAEIPFGRIEGVGLSDASKLVDVHGWSEAGLVGAHLVLGGLCLVVIAARWAWGLGGVSVRSRYSPY